MKFLDKLKIRYARLQEGIYSVGAKLIDGVIGCIPYHASVKHSLVLEKKNKYSVTIASPRLNVQLRSLDRIFRVNLQLVKPWVEYQGSRRKQQDTNVSLRWTFNEGWWIEGQQTGRRTRPMPRLVGALLCGALIWTYPELLEIVLTHSEKTKRYVWAYIALGGVTLALVGLVGFYMWLGFKSGTSGLEYALKRFSKVFGEKDRKEHSIGPEETEEESSEENKARIDSRSE